MRRREFIRLIGGAVAAWPLAARAQQPALPVIGFLNSQSSEAYASYTDAFRTGLKDAGYIEGQNVAIEYRWADGHYDRLPALAAELVRRRVAVIAAIATPTALAAKAATSTIPVVFLIGGDPVQEGLIASFNRPGGNFTGSTMLTLSLDGKRLGLLREVLPQASTITFLANPNFPDAKARNLRLQEVAHAIGLELVVLGATTEAEINKVLSDFDHQRPGALLVGGDPFFTSHRDQIVALVARKAIPAMYEWREFAAAGGLMSYGTKLRDIYRQVGLYAGRIVKGEKPADMPVVQPTKFEFVINLKTAKTLGLTIPPGVLAVADEVIE